MKLHRRHVTIIGVAMVVMLGTASPWNGQGAQARQRQKMPAGAPGETTRASQKNAVLEAAMSRCEDLAENALAGKVKDMDLAIQTLEGQNAHIVGALSPEAGRQLEARLAAILQKRAANDLPGVALEAVEAYRVLATAKERGKLKIPLEVDLLDYAGFKVKVLATRTAPGLAGDAGHGCRRGQGLAGDTGKGGRQESQERHEYVHGRAESGRGGAGRGHGPFCRPGGPGPRGPPGTAI